MFKEFFMLYSNKFISVPVVISSFIGVTVAVSLSFALQASINNASAAQSANQTTAQVNTTEDFAKFAYAFNQGYEASATSASSSSGQVCAEATVSSTAGF